MRITTSNIGPDVQSALAARLPLFIDSSLEGHFEFCEDGLFEALEVCLRFSLTLLSPGRCQTGILEFLHFNIGVREPIDVHGRQVGAALHAYTQTSAAMTFTSFSFFSSLWALFLQIEWRHKLQREKKTTSLLQAVQLLVLPLWTKLHYLISLV